MEAERRKTPSNTQSPQATKPNNSKGERDNKKVQPFCGRHLSLQFLGWCPWKCAPAHGLNSMKLLASRPVSPSQLCSAFPSGAHPGFQSSQQKEMFRIQPSNVAKFSARNSKVTFCMSLISSIDVPRSMTMFTATVSGSKCVQITSVSRSRSKM